MWKIIGSEGEIEMTKCWDFMLGDVDLATILGNGNHDKGKKMLEIMRAVRALDPNGDGQIDALEFQRMYLPSVILAAESAVYAGFYPDYLLPL